MVLSGAPARTPHTRRVPTVGFTADTRQRSVGRLARGSTRRHSTVPIELRRLPVLLTPSHAALDFTLRLDLEGWTSALLCVFVLRRLLLDDGGGRYARPCPANLPESKLTLPGLSSAF